MSRSPLLTALLVVMALLLAFGAGHAREPGDRGPAPEQLAASFLDGVSRRVVLTPGEHAAALAILTEQAAKRQEVVRARLAAHPGATGMMALRHDLQRLARETDARLAGVLPPEKMTIVREYRDSLKQQALRRLERLGRSG